MRVAVALALAWSAAVLAEAVVLPVHHRLPTELVQVIGPLLERDERVAAVPNGIWIQASPHRIEEIRALVERLDRRLQRLVITVLQTDRFSLEELNAHLGVAGGLAPAVGATARVYETRSQGSLGTQQRLEVLEGKPAFIAVGTELPVPQINLFGPQAVGGIDYLPATAGFQVTPRLISCRVQLTVSPWSRRPGGLGGELAVHAAETTLEAPLGHWVEIGAHRLDEDLAATEILGHRYETSARRLHLFLRVEAPAGCEGEK